MRYWLLCCWLLVGCTTEQPDFSLEVASTGLLAGALSHDGQLAIVGAQTQGGSLWTLDDNERLYNWNHQADTMSTLISASFSPDKRWAITADDTSLVLWNVNTGEASRYWQAPAEILSMALSPNGQWALLGLRNNTAVIFNIRRGGVMRTFTHKGAVNSVDISHDGRIAITGSDDNSAIIWDTNTAKAMHTLKTNEAVQLVRLSQDGELGLVMAKYDQAIVWNLNQKQPVGAIALGKEKIKRGVRFTAAAFSPDNSQLLTGLPNRRVQLWSLDDLSKQQEWALPKRKRWQPTSASVAGLAFTKQAGAFRVSTSDGFIHTLTTTGQK